MSGNPRHNHVIGPKESPSVTWGTGSGALARVKAESEEARLNACHECGFSAGRHSRSCSRRAS